jgi:hypothetical protein
VAPVGTGHHNGFNNSNGFLPNNSLRNGCNGAPGFGFDYTNFFATHPNCNNVAFGGFALPFVGGGFYVPMSYYTDSGSEDQVASNPTREPSQTSDEVAAAREPEVQPEAHENTYAPLKPVSEFVFVKRDGTIVYAVAYSLSKDKIQYVTKEGLRRTLTLDTLDYDATEKSNEERGNTVNLPKAMASSVV